MRANYAIFWLLSLFFGISAVVYALWTMADASAPQIVGPGTNAELAAQPEWVGTVGLTLTSILATFLAFYVGLLRKSTGGELPEDRDDALIDDADPEMGHFSPWSWWPLVLSVGVALVFLGLAVGVWIALIGGPIAVIGIVGWNYEYYRGNFAR